MFFVTKMKEKISETVELPEGITAEVKEKELILIGPKGTLSRFFNNPKINMSNEDSKIVFSCNSATKREKKQINTDIAHVNNLIKGTIDGFTYKLKVCSSHFPMGISVSGNKFEVKNYLGEKVPRILKFDETVKISVNGEEILVESNNKELAGQTAANIELLTRRTGFDRRVFQDGIYITEKAGKIIK